MHRREQDRRRPRFEIVPRDHIARELEFARSLMTNFTSS
jgi:hypothetical protein